MLVFVAGCNEIILMKISAGVRFGNAHYDFSLIASKGLLTEVYFFCKTSGRN
jgi:hypothetical protein